MSPKSDAATYLPCAGGAPTGDTTHTQTGHATMALPHPPEAPKTQKKRRRPALACEQCRKRKIRCDRNVPCNHCIKSNITDCSYVPTHIPASWLKRNQKAYGESSRPTGDQPPYILPIPAASNSSKDNAIPPSEFIGGSREIQTITARPTASAPSSVTGSTSNASNNVDRLVSRIHHLEEKLANVVTISDDNDHASPEDTQSSAHIHGTVSKTRYFGRSHWMNGPALVSAASPIVDQTTDYLMSSYQCR